MDKLPRTREHLCCRLPRGVQHNIYSYKIAFGVRIKSVSRATIVYWSILFESSQPWVLCAFQTKQFPLFHRLKDTLCSTKHFMFCYPYFFLSPLLSSDKFVLFGNSNESRSAVGKFSCLINVIGKFACLTRNLVGKDIVPLQLSDSFCKRQCHCLSDINAVIQIPVIERYKRNV